MFLNILLLINKEMKIKWKKKFLERYSKLTELDEFLEYSLKPLPKTIRINTLKTSVKHMQEKFDLKPIPWCKEGFYLNGLGLGNLQEHFLGQFYIQSSASMIPPIVLNPKPNETVLDMCASPGSKTSQMAAMMKNKGIIIANDIQSIRLKPLTANLQRLGVSNCLITLMNGLWFKNMEFDKILLDAPCSGIGTIRKSYKTIEMWNPKFANFLARTQRKLFNTAIKMLKPSGTLVYSTCTLEPEENEGLLNQVLQDNKNIHLEKFELDIKRSKPITNFNNEEYSSEIKKALRIWPQDNNTEGFFVAKIKKE